MERLGNRLQHDVFAWTTVPTSKQWMTCSVKVPRTPWRGEYNQTSGGRTQV
jgi:hypothetical protein